MNLIVAGNYAQAQNFARDKNWRPRDYIIATERAKIRGLENLTVYFVGTWAQSNAMRQVREELFYMRGIKCEYVE